MPLTRARTTGSRIARGGRAARAAAALVLSVGLLGAASCGFDVQTNRPYTPGQGVNVNVGSPAVQVRNLMVLTREEGEGFLSATMSVAGRDSLTAVSGTPIKPDYTAGAAFTVELPAPVPLANQLVVLTNRPLITLASPDLQIGGEAELKLSFSTAGDVTIRVPVVDADEQPYRSISPTPDPSPSS